jgi:hypothetical protein
MKTEVGRNAYQSIHLINSLAGKAVYPYGSIDNNFAPIQFSLDSTLAVNISHFYLLMILHINTRCQI